jgi:hypothetical protein
MQDLRQQVQLLKRQTMTVLDQARKLSDREQASLLRTQESLNLEKASTSKAARSVERENYMLDLMTDASQVMDGALRFFLQTRLIFPVICLLYCSFFLVIGSFVDIAAEEQRVNLRVRGLLRLATEANVDFWADETRCHRIV